MAAPLKSTLFPFDCTTLGWQFPRWRKSVMCKGILIALLAFIFLTTCDYYWSDGRYTAAAIVMTKQIGRAYGI